MIEIEPGYEPCRYYGRDTNKIGAACYCECEYDEYGDVTHDCGSCSDGLIYVECDDRFVGPVAESIGFFLHAQRMLWFRAECSTSTSDGYLQ